LLTNRFGLLKIREKYHIPDVGSQQLEPDLGSEKTKPLQVLYLQGL